MTRQRDVNIRIEHIIVDGAGMPRPDALRVHAAIEAELARLLSPSRAPIAGGAARSLSAVNPLIGRATTAERLGQEIARSLHGLVMGVR